MHIAYRVNVNPEDCVHVRRIVQSSSFFSAEEVEVAEELVNKRLEHGERSGYHFMFADTCKMPVGYTCFGRIPGTACSFDLYWIALLERFRGRGIGRELLLRTEALIIRMGGCRLYAETSSRPLYESTRAFYEHNGFKGEAVLEDFYAFGDGKVIYIKKLERGLQDHAG